MNSTSHTALRWFRVAALVASLWWCRETGAAEPNTRNTTPRPHRILYNLDGDSCMTLKAGRTGPGPMTTSDLTNIVAELSASGSQVDALLVCINAQVLYYPTKVGTQRGMDCTEAERRAWPPGEKQRFENLRIFFDAGVDPYAVLISEARRRGMEGWVTFRMNDAHGNDFLRTRFAREHPEWALPGGALDFGVPEVRSYVIALIREVIERYDADGLELDFQRFPRFFKQDALDPNQRVAALNELVGQIRQIASEAGNRRGRPWRLGVRAPSGIGDFQPTPERARQLGCDLAHWAQRGWVDWISVSEWLFGRDTLGLGAWKSVIPSIPIYGAIQPESQSSPDPDACDTCHGEAGYRRLAWERWRDGADGIYLFNFFTTREWKSPLEPPFSVLSQIGSPERLAQFVEGPWETNVPIATVTRALHVKHPAPRRAAMASEQYVGPGLERREWRASEEVSDVADAQHARWSQDNGKTWGNWVPQQPSSLVDYNGTNVWEGGWADTFDPESGQLLQLWLRQIELKGQFHCFTYIRTSKDAGRSWSSPTPLQYEAGPTFDPANPANPNFLERNQGYPGSSICLRRDGSRVVALAHANAPSDPKNATRAWRLGSVLFLGTWDPATRAIHWQPGARTEIEFERSARGLMEPDITELKDGRLLIVWRGSDRAWDGTPAREPGRKWYAISSDGGRTLGSVQPWTYSDGSLFYSSSSIHRFLRHSVTRKLYWFGNVSGKAPEGNHPRHPLVMAEVDEESGTLKRETLTVLAERGLRHSAQVQFSNFSLLEDRVSHHLELLLTTYGQETASQDWATADCWKLRVQLGR